MGKCRITKGICDVDLFVGEGMVVSPKRWIIPTSLLIKDNQAKFAKLREAGGGDVFPNAVVAHALPTDKGSIDGVRAAYKVAEESGNLKDFMFTGVTVKAPKGEKLAVYRSEIGILLLLADAFADTVMNYSKVTTLGAGMPAKNEYGYFAISLPQAETDEILNLTLKLLV